MPREHAIDPSVIHHQWDLDLEPILAIASGDTVSYDIKVAGEGQVWPGATYADTRFDFDTIYNLSGPVWVDGAEPGDTLQVDILDLRHGDWGGPRSCLSSACCRRTSRTGTCARSR